MKLAFSTAARIRLCFALVAVTALVSHSLTAYCWAVLAQPSGPFLQPPYPKTWRIGWAIGGEVDISRSDDLNWPKGYSIPYEYLTQQQKLKKGKLKGGILTMKSLSFQATMARFENLLPKTWMNIAYWWQVENIFFFFFTKPPLVFCCCCCYLFCFIFFL